MTKKALPLAYIIVLGLACIVGAFVHMNGCDDKREISYEPYESIKAREELEIRQYKADLLISEVNYAKDPRTGLCFACWFGNHGVPSLTTVPCEAIPPDLLTEGKSKSE